MKDTSLFTKVFILIVAGVCLYSVYQAGATRGEDVGMSRVCFDVGYESDLCEELLYRQSVEPPQYDRF